MAEITEEFVLKLVQQLTDGISKAIWEVRRDVYEGNGTGVVEMMAPIDVEEQPSQEDLNKMFEKDIDGWADFGGEE